MNMTDNKFVTGEYLGKEYLKLSGVDKNGKTWKKFKTTFSCGREGRDDMKLSFGTFDIYARGFDKLIEGDLYTISYEESEYDHPEHGKVKSKNAREFVPTTGKNVNTPESKTESGMLYPLDELYEKYKGKIQEQDRDIAKFCQFYIAANHPQKYKDIKEFYTKREDKDMGEIIQ